MLLEELHEGLKARGIDNGSYSLEQANFMIFTLYPTLDLDKETFFNLMQATDLRMLKQMNHWREVADAVERREAQVKYLYNRSRLDELRQEYRATKAAVDKYERENYLAPYLNDPFDHNELGENM